MDKNNEKKTGKTLEKEKQEKKQQQKQILNKDNKNATK